MSDTLVTETEETPASEPVEVQENDDTQADETTGKADRRPRGWLESDVKAITDRYVTGEFTVKDDKPLTPHRLADAVKTEGELGSAPSTGAVSAVLHRWVKLGFITVSEKPFAFLDYTEEGRTEGLASLKARRAESLKAARAAAKADAGEGETNQAESSDQE